MLGLIRTQKQPDFKIAAKSVYADLLRQSRHPWFYREAGAPDSFDGRFDILLLHVFFVVHHLCHQGASGQAFNQALFDAMFFDMDQTLREMGIGDMGVPKHMRRMMKAFNGRIQAYEAAWQTSDSAFTEALRRNVYGGAAPSSGQLQLLAAYAKGAVMAMEAQEVEVLLAGSALLANPG